MIDFEDNYLDCIKKAAKGKGFSNKTLSKKLGITLDEIDDFYTGIYSEKILNSICSILDLDYTSLKSHAFNPVVPVVKNPSGFFNFQTEFYFSIGSKMHVNHYLVIDKDTDEAFLFDTGTNSQDTINLLNRKNKSLKAIFLTHTHDDHTLAIKHYIKEFPEAELYLANDKLNISSNLEKVQLHRPYSYKNIKITAFPTPGHSDDGTSYLVNGLNIPIIFSGDSIFAHSQGGTKNKESYKIAIKSNLANIMSLDNNTIIAPGHGPLTTVGHEKKYNPFYSKLIR